MQKEVKLKLLDTGYCLNFEKMVARDGQMKVKRFYAMVGLIEHPIFGSILFDTGYSAHVKKLCKRFPYFMYSLITPVKFGHCFQKPEEVKHVILSHFHPDHIGGVKDFPQAKIYCSKKAYEESKKLSYFRQLKEIFFNKLLPIDFDSRMQDIQCNEIDIPFYPFTKGFDIFRDGSIIAVFLPGHARGQIGIFLKTSTQVVFLCADACFQTSNIQNLEYPHFLARAAIDNYPAFLDTLQQIHLLKKNHPEIEIIPSHCFEMWEKYVKGDIPC